MTTLKRIIKTGFVNFSRGGVVSFASVLVVTITLSVIMLTILLQAVLYSSLNIIKNKVDVTVYFNVGAPEEKIVALRDSIAKLPEVRDVSYVSADQALEDFKERHKNDYATLEALKEIGTNPLGGYLNVKAKEVSQYESISEFLKSDNALVVSTSSIIDKVNYNQNKLIIDRLNNIISGTQKLSFLITLVLIIISSIMTFNTIKLTIFISKEEISVMRLVGASKMHIRGPFLIEGAIYGVSAALLTVLLFWPITAWLGHNMTYFLSLNLFDYYLSNIFQIFAIILISGIILGMTSSLIAIRRYLKK